MNAREKTQQSIRDGFGGDTLRRRKISENEYQCGCRWVNASEDHEVFERVRGDVLKLCPFHSEICR